MLIHLRDFTSLVTKNIELFKSDIYLPYKSRTPGIRLAFGIVPYNHEISLHLQLWFNNSSELFKKLIENPIYTSTLSKLIFELYGQIYFAIDMIKRDLLTLTEKQKEMKSITSPPAYMSMDDESEIFSLIDGSWENIKAQSTLINENIDAIDKITRQLFMETTVIADPDINLHEKLMNDVNKLLSS